ncbi:MAG: hypothetical protein ACLR0U_18755 [Enterocloster clostridioformis]
MTEKGAAHGRSGPAVDSAVYMKHDLTVGLNRIRFFNRRTVWRLSLPITRVNTRFPDIPRQIWMPIG